jgi:aminoglycoside phosphotransferase (APT) family kinase protein
VWAVSSTRGELILRVQAAETGWTQHLRVLRRAAEAGVAPEARARRRGSARRRLAAGGRSAAAAALMDPGQRGAAIASLVGQLRTLHALDPTGVDERDPVAYARAQLAAQRGRPGFPAWAADLEPVFAATEATLAGDPRRVVSHNDVNPGNVVWDGTRAWLVDWEVAGLNHPFYDLATLAMFIQLDDPVAHALLAQQEGHPIDAAAGATFAALRRLAALLCGLTFLGMVPDLSLVPEPAPTLSAFLRGLARRQACSARSGRPRRLRRGVAPGLFVRRR